MEAAEWMKKFEQLGRDNDYTPSQIEEYKAYITLAQLLGEIPE
jgi:hypothetical protein